MSSTSQRPTHRLIIRRDLRVVDTAELASDTLTLGRSNTCDIVLAHEAVSRVHARFEPRDDGWHVVDEGSANGVFVNGAQRASARIEPGDVVEVRPFSMNVLGGRDDAASQDQSVYLTTVTPQPTLIRDVGVELRPAEQRLEDLYGLSRLVVRRDEDGSFWPQFFRTLHHSLAADRCVILGVVDVAGLYRLAPRARTAGPERPLEVSQSVVQRVVESGQAMLIQQVASDDRFREAQSLAVANVGSVLCVPVVVDDKTRAMVYAERQVARSPFQAEDLDFVVAAVDLAAAAVRMDELHARARELARVRGRIEAARELQEMLLPHPVPQPTWGEVAARNYPAEQMSGDIFDVLIDKQGRLVVSIADVTGHGVPAAFLTGILQDTFRHAVTHFEDLGEIVQRVNESMAAYSKTGCFATMVVCRFGAAGEHVEIANAGHHAPLWCDAEGRVEAYPDRVGMILGFEPTWDGRVLERDVGTEAVCLLTSDGAVEAIDAQREPFDTERLIESLQATRDASAEQIITTAFHRVREHTRPREPKDDVTFLVVKRG